MGATVWTADPPKYPGYYWAISQHGEIDMVRVRCVLNDYPSTGVQSPTKFNYTFGDTCASDPVRWTHWTPVVPPAKPETLPVASAVKEASPKKMGNKERNTKMLEDAIREHTKQPPLEARFQSMAEPASEEDTLRDEYDLSQLKPVPPEKQHFRNRQRLQAQEGDTVSDTVGLGEGMMVIDGVAVVPDQVFGIATEDPKPVGEVSDREKGWNVIPKFQLEELSKIAHGKSELTASQITQLAQHMAQQISFLNEAGRDGAYRRLRAVNPTVLCMVKSFVTDPPATKEKADNSLPRP